MPRVSEFYGIVVSLYFLDQKQHAEPHFHARYAEHEAVFRIPDAEVLAGSLPRSQRRMVEAWAEIHRTELAENWARVAAGREAFKIPPLQ